MQPPVTSCLGSAFTAFTAFPAWAALDPRKRAELVVDSLATLPEDHDERVELLSRENGKVRFECALDMDVLAGRFHFAAERVGRLEEVERIPPPRFRTEVSRLPLGVVSIIVAFNWPTPRCR